jgi:hypothetical protein
VSEGGRESEGREPQGGREGEGRCFQARPARFWAARPLSSGPPAPDHGAAEWIGAERSGEEERRGKGGQEEDRGEQRREEESIGE